MLVYKALNSVIDYKVLVYKALNSVIDYKVLVYKALNSVIDYKVLVYKGTTSVIDYEVFRLNDGPGAKLSSVGWCLMLVFGWAHHGSTRDVL